MFRPKQYNALVPPAANAKLFGFTFGNIAFAAFLIAAASGVLLAVPFDVKNPYDSLSYMLLANPAGVFFRNVHYWSAQLFLIFSLLHLYDHLKRNTEREVKNGLWARLTFSIFVIFFVMLSGFIIKGDADSQQARLIIGSLIEQIPFIGKALSISLLGSHNDYQILYVNHIAAATIFLWIVIVEHAKYIWPRLRLVLYLLPALVLLGYLFPPALHDNLNPVIKGPWYFLGLQEILHWLSLPWIAMLLALILLAAVYLLRRMPLSKAYLLKKILFGTAVVYGVLTIVGFYFRGADWQFTWPWNNPVVTKYQFEPFDNTSAPPDSELAARGIPVVLNRREGCLYCHSNVKGFSPAHNPEAIGCVSCHSGNPFTLDKNYAHQGMILVPGNISEAKTTCGSAGCHSDISDRIQNTLMTTMSGVVSVDKYVFGELKSPDHFGRIDDIGYSPAGTHLRELCASCHLSGKKTELGPVTQLSRGGGCNACHLNYDSLSIKDLKNISRLSTGSGDSSGIFYHPSLSVKITDDHCFGCHSRSGRISANYEGWHDTLFREDDVKADSSYRILEDGRVFVHTQADIHYDKGMSCIDCHTSRETMGDGVNHIHEEDQVKVACTDCHFNGRADTKTYNELDSESQKIIDLRNYDTKHTKFLVVKASGYPLVNTYINDKNEPELRTKLSNKSLPLKPPAFVCNGNAGHKDLSCGSCHTAWATQCVGCHTQYYPDESGYDLLSKEKTEGTWIETPKDYLSEPPALGVRIIKSANNKTAKVIDNFIPGMIISIRKDNINPNSPGDKNLIFKRLYAPSFPHTISKTGRLCKSCHNDPVALGYGRGSLDYVIDGSFGRWKFTPKYPLLKYDGLPEDAWIGFLKARGFSSTSRTNTRPFDVDEQKIILTVGACLTCHKDDSKPMKEFLLTGKMPAVSRKCILPKWN